MIVDMADNVSGLYKVDGRFFTSKIESLLHASTVKKTATFYYYDEVWDKTIETFKYTSDINLLAMYKNRAEQLRNKYDYLVLHFSGGSDSTTVLESFIHNNIKLDEVYVKWPTKLLNSSVYTPNVLDFSPTNMLSEWDFSIKPKLDWLRSVYPEIKIVVEDWTDDLYAFQTKQINEDLFLKHNQNFGLVNFIFSEMLSKSSMEKQESGLKVGHIYGAEKPLLMFQNNSFYTFYNDASTNAVGFQHAHGKTDPTNKINFYHAIDYPELTIARAYAMMEHLKKNPSMLYLIHSANRFLPIDVRTKNIDLFQKLCSKVLYPNWNTKNFQVDKHDLSNRLYHPWYHYVFDRPEFIDKQNMIERKVKDFAFGINSEYKIFDVDGNTIGFKPISTKLFKLK